MKYKAIYLFVLVLVFGVWASKALAMESQDFVLENPVIAPMFESDSNDFSSAGTINYFQNGVETEGYYFAQGDADRIILPTPDVPVLSNNLDSSSEINIQVRLGDNDESVVLQVRLIDTETGTQTYYSPLGETTSSTSWARFSEWSSGGKVIIKNLDQNLYYQAQVRVKQEDFSLSNFSELSNSITPKVLAGGVDPNEEGVGDDDVLPDTKKPSAIQSIINTINPKELLKDKQVQDSLTAIATVLIPITAVAIASQIGAISSIVVQLIANILQRLLGSILSFSQFFAFMGKKKIFGRVLGGKRKKPIEGAKVTLFKPDTRRVIDTQVTDEKGRYYFLSNPRASYILQIRKDGYDSFEKVLRGRVNIKILLGQELEYDELELLKKSRTIRIFNRINKARIPLLVIGSLSWALIFFINQTTIAIALGAYYAMAWALELFVQRQPRPYGLITSFVSNEPLSMVVVRVFNNNRLISTLVSDDQGRFKTLLRPGVYTMRFSKVGYETTTLSDVNINNRVSSLGIDVKLKQNITNQPQVEPSY